MLHDSVHVSNELQVVKSVEDWLTDTIDTCDFDPISSTKLEDCRIKLKQMLSARPVGKNLRYRSKTRVLFVLFRSSRLNSLMFGSHLYRVTDPIV